MPDNLTSNTFKRKNQIDDVAGNYVNSNAMSVIFKRTNLMNHSALEIWPLKSKNMTLLMMRYHRRFLGKVAINRLLTKA